MSSTFKVLFYLRKNYVNKQGRAAIMVRITIGGDIVQFSSKIDAEPQMWNTQTTRLNGRSAEAQKINQQLDDIRSSIIHHYREISDREVNVTAEKVRNAFLGIVTKGETLLQLFNKHIEDSEKLVGISITKATLQKYKVTRTRVTEFMLERYKIKDISLKEINHMFITDLANYLRTEAACSNNTTAKFLQFFKRIILIARNNGWLLHDPFANYKIQLKAVDRGFLDKDEIAMLAQKEFDCERLDQVRDIFLFSCFSGLAYIDISNLSAKNIRKSFDGKMWIMTKRQKTKVEFHVPLLDMPLKIIKKYKGQGEGDKLFRMLSATKTNYHLKIIAQMCGIERDITYHQARHSYASLITLSQGVPMETVSKMLGHSSIKSTHIYAKISNEKIDQDMIALEERIKGKYYLADL